MEPKLRQFGSGCASMFIFVMVLFLYTWSVALITDARIVTDSLGPACAFDTDMWNFEFSAPYWSTSIGWTILIGALLAAGFMRFVSLGVEAIDQEGTALLNMGDSSF